MVGALFAAFASLMADYVKVALAFSYYSLLRAWGFR